MASDNLPLQPGFSIRVQQGSNPLIEFTVLDRAGKKIDLTGKTIKLAAKTVTIESNGQGKRVLKERIFFDLTATITNATTGDISIQFTGVETGRAGDLPASLRIWNDATTNRAPDDAYDGTYSTADAVVREEA